MVIRSVLIEGVAILFAYKVYVATWRVLTRINDNISNRRNYEVTGVVTVCDCGGRCVCRVDAGYDASKMSGSKTSSKEKGQEV